VTNIAVVTQPAASRMVPVLVAAPEALVLDLGHLTPADYPQAFRAWKSAERLVMIVPAGWVARAEREWRAEHRRLFPRRKTLVYRDLPEAYRAEVEARLRGEYALYKDNCRARARHLAEVLEALAPHADLTPQPEMIQLRVSSGHTFSGQTQPNKYAREALAADEVILAQAGFATRVEVVDEMRGPTAYGWEYHVQDFGLFANAAEWQLDAARRRVTMTTGEWIDLLKARGVNPMVYNPFLPPGAVYP